MAQPWKALNAQHHNQLNITYSARRRKSQYYNGLQGGGHVQYEFDFVFRVESEQRKHNDSTSPRLERGTQQMAGSQWQARRRILRSGVNGRHQSTRTRIVQAHSLPAFGRRKGEALGITEQKAGKDRYHRNHGTERYADRARFTHFRIAEKVGTDETFCSLVS